MSPRRMPWLVLLLAQVALAADPAATLAKARKEFQDVEYARVIPLAEAVLADPYATYDQRVEAHVLCGSALAVVRDGAEAERHFRLLLRLKPDADLPANTAPKILAPFRKVQVEEKALAAQLAADHRARVRAGIKLVGEPPKAGPGGRALGFSFGLKDPTGAVENLRVAYRRRGDTGFSSLALEPRGDGRYGATLPAELTANEQGLTLEYFVEASDTKGPLLSVGSAPLPLSLELSPGQVRGSPPPLSRRSFAVSAFAAGLAAVSWAGFGISTLVLSDQLESSLVDTQVYASRLATGNALAVSANVAAISTAVLAVLSIVLVPFTNWHPEE